MGKHPDSEKLIPFRRRSTGYYLPDLEDQAEKKRIARIDTGLQPEEQGFVRRYLGYADVLLRGANDGAGSHAKVIGMPRRKRPSRSAKKSTGGKRIK